MYFLCIYDPLLSLMKVMKAVKKKMQLMMVKNIYRMVRKKYICVLQGIAIAHTIHYKF